MVGAPHLDPIAQNTNRETLTKFLVKGPRVLIIPLTAEFAASIALLAARRREPVSEKDMPK